MNTEPCDIPGCDNPATKRIPIIGNRDGWLTKINVCTAHRSPR